MTELVKHLALANNAQEADHLLARLIEFPQHAVTQQAARLQDVFHTPNDPQKAMQQALQKITMADSVMPI